MPPASPAVDARDKVLWTNIFTDALAPFLVPKDLGRFAQTCREASKAVYNADGLSVATSLDLALNEALDPHRMKLVLGASFLCKINMANLRVLRIGRGQEMQVAGGPGVNKEEDLDTVTRILQLLMSCPKLEVFEFVGARSGADAAAFGAALSSVGRKNLRELVIGSEVACASTPRSAGAPPKRWGVETLRIWNLQLSQLRDTWDLPRNSFLALDIAESRAVRNLAISFWKPPRAESLEIGAPFGDFCRAVFPAVQTFSLSEVRPDKVKRNWVPFCKSIAGMCHKLRSLTIGECCNERAALFCSQSLRGFISLETLRTLRIRELDIRPWSLSAWVSFLKGLKVRELYLPLPAEDGEYADFSMSERQCGVFVGFLAGGGLKTMSKSFRARLYQQLRARLHHIFLTVSDSSGSESEG